MTRQVATRDLCAQIAKEEGSQQPALSLRVPRILRDLGEEDAERGYFTSDLSWVFNKGPVLILSKRLYTVCLYNKFINLISKTQTDWQHDILIIKMFWNCVTPAGCEKWSLVFSVPGCSGQAWKTVLFLAGSGSVVFTMTTMATLRLTRRA